MGEVVNRDEEKTNDIWRGLKDTIDWVEGNRGKWGEGVHVVILVVETVDIFVEELVGVELTVHPVDTNLEEDEVKKSRHEVLAETTKLFNGEVDLSPTRLDQELRENWESSIDEEGELSKGHLINESSLGGKRTTLGGVELLLEENIDEKRPDTSSDPVNEGTKDKISQVGVKVVAKLMTVLLIDEGVEGLEVKDVSEDTVDELIDLSIWVGRSELKGSNEGWVSKKLSWLNNESRSRGSKKNEGKDILKPKNEKI